MMADEKRKIMFMMIAMQMIMSATATSRRSVRIAFAPTTSLRKFSSSNYHNAIKTPMQVTAANIFTEDDITSSSKSSSLHTVMVKRNRQSQNFREGAPLIFGNSIAATFSENGDDSSIPLGSLVAVYVGRADDSQKQKGKKYKKSKPRSEPVYSHTNYDSSGAEQYRTTINNSQLIGFGVYNPHSMYRVRILCHATQHPVLAKDSKRKQKQRVEDHDNEILKSILERKIADATNLRLAMDLPSEATDTYRLLNGEGDGCSGLAVDIIGGCTAVVMSSAAWCEVHKETIMDVLERSLREHPSYDGVDIEIIWRNTPSRLKQDGYELSSVESEKSDDYDVPVIATESSVKYRTYPYSNGQKTGFYSDQRDNRLMVAEYCKGKRVLDLCCYNGGFALNAMMQGATESIGVDSSQDAVDAATTNAVENDLDQTKISFVRDDIAAYMKTAMSQEEEFDVIVLDPPKLAPSLSTLDKASRKYHALNRDAMNLINKEGGLLLTCTCSAAMTQKDGGQYFLNVVNGAGLSAKRRVTLLRVNGAAPCHTQSPASFPAGAYLTAALFHVGPVGS